MAPAIGFRHQPLPTQPNAFGAAQLTGGASPVVDWPSPIVVGRPLALHVVNKYDPNVPDEPLLEPPANIWFNTAQVSGGAGASGADSGVIVNTLFTRILDGSETGTANVPITSANSSIARMLTFRCLRAQRSAGDESIPGTWSLAAASGARNLADATFVVTFGSDPGIQRGDLCIVFAGYNRDGQGTPAPAMRTTLVVPGCDMSYGIVRTNNASTTGDDCGYSITQFHCLYGTSSGAAVYTATMSGAPAGAAVLLRLRWTPT